MVLRAYQSQQLAADSSGARLSVPATQSLSLDEILAKLARARVSVLHARQPARPPARSPARPA